MNLLFLICVPTLAGFFVLVMNDLSFKTHRASEQIRLDASTLSICTSRKRFLKEELTPLNERIETLRDRMDQLAIKCDALLATGVGAAACAALTAAIRALGATALGLTTYRESLRALSPLRNQAHFKNLAMENQIPLASLRLHWTGLDDGYKFEPLSQSQLKWQAMHQTPWPKILRQTPLFEKKNQLAGELRPQRQVLSSDSKVLFRLESRRVQHRAGGQTRSLCQITKNFDLKRKEDR